MTNRKRILTGDRPTGKLHLGHLVGSLQNRVTLQHQYETFIIIADIQALTTNFESPEKLSNDVRQVALDNLAVGIDPDQTTLFIQSLVPQIAELTVIYSMFISVNSLKHNPTTKAEAIQRGYNDLTYGFLGYPISQTADITFCKADLVPVGEDQLPHIEFARKLVRRFNSLYKPILVEPEALLSDCSRLIGIDGNSKMSKSLQNAIFLADLPEQVQQKVHFMPTDPNRIRLTDKGTPDVCVVYKYHTAFNKTESENIANMCRNAAIGCTTCKKNLSSCLNNVLEPIRHRRTYYEQHTDRVDEILVSGTEKVKALASETMREIREAMSINYFKL